MCPWFSRTDRLSRRLWTDLYCLIGFVIGTAIWYEWAIRSCYVSTEVVLMADGLVLTLALEDIVRCVSSALVLKRSLLPANMSQSVTAYFARNRASYASAVLFLQLLPSGAFSLGWYLDHGGQLGALTISSALSLSSLWHSS